MKTRRCPLAFFLISLFIIQHGSTQSEDDISADYAIDGDYAIYGDYGKFLLADSSDVQSSRRYMSSMSPEIINQPAQEIVYEASKGVMLECVTKLAHTQVNSFWVLFSCPSHIWTLSSKNKIRVVMI